MFILMLLLTLCVLSISSLPLSIFLRPFRLPSHLPYVIARDIGHCTTVMLRLAFNSIVDGEFIVVPFLFFFFFFVLIATSSPQSQWT